MTTKLILGRGLAVFLVPFPFRGLKTRIKEAAEQSLGDENRFEADK